MNYKNVGKKHWSNSYQKVDKIVYPIHEEGIYGKFNE